VIDKGHGSAVLHALKHPIEILALGELPLDGKEPLALNFTHFLVLGKCSQRDKQTMVFCDFIIWKLVPDKYPFVPPFDKW